MPSLETPDGYQPVPDFIYDREGSSGDVFILFADNGETVAYLEFNMAEDASHLRRVDGEYYFDTVYHPKNDRENGHPDFVNEQEYDRDVVLDALDTCNVGMWFTPRAVRNAYRNYLEDRTVWTERPQMRLSIDEEGTDIALTHFRQASPAGGANSDRAIFR